MNLEEALDRGFLKLAQLVPQRQGTCLLDKLRRREEAALWLRGRS